MNSGIFSKLILAFAVLFGGTFATRSAFAQEEVKSEVPSFKMSGDVALLSNYVEHGLTQTNKDPSLQAGFSFNFGPQFKLGLWGSNVNYQSTEHFLLRLFGELKVQITSSTDVKISYRDSIYFKTDTRNGTSINVLVSSSGYHGRFEANSNWEGTGNSSNYYALGKIIDLNPNWKWDNEGGYTMLGSSTYSDFFDFRTTALYKGGSNITYQLSLTATSSPSQFNGRGDIMPYVGASTSF
jgi:uncharacterized protein (TIGR02001 family)